MRKTQKKMLSGANFHSTIYLLKKQLINNVVYYIDDILDVEVLLFFFIFHKSDIKLMNL